MPVSSLCGHVCPGGMLYWDPPFPGVGSMQASGAYLAAHKLLWVYIRSMDHSPRTLGGKSKCC